MKPGLLETKLTTVTSWCSSATHLRLRMLSGRFPKGESFLNLSLPHLYLTPHLILLRLPLQHSKATCSLHVGRSKPSPLPGLTPHGPCMCQPTHTLLCFRLPSCLLKDLMQILFSQKYTFLALAARTLQRSTSVLHDPSHKKPPRAPFPQWHWLISTRARGLLPLYIC